MAVGKKRSKPVKLYDQEKIKLINQDTQKYWKKYQQYMSIKELSEITIYNYNSDLSQWFIFILDNQFNQSVVDLAEDDDKVEKVRAVNAKGTENIALVCKKLDCKMIYISTDYVFNGQGETPWDPDCKDYKPLNVYGQTKLEGELAVSSNLDKYFIIRIAWVFGVNGKNFIKTMLNVGKKYPQVKVVNDQIGTLTYTYDLARLLVDMAESDKYGYYHATNEGGYISWYDFTVEIFKQAGYTTEVLPVTTEEYGLSKAARPFNSRLDKSKLVENGFKPLPTWQDALSRYLKEIEY